MNQTKREVVFSIELETRENLKTVKMAEGDRECVLLEGSIGELAKAGFNEGIVFEVVGLNGTLRINLTPSEIEGETGKKVSNIWVS